MSILETFYILFKTDADEAAKDINDVDKASDKAAAGLGKMDTAAGGVGAAFKRMGAAIAGPLLALASSGAVFQIALGRAAAIRELDQFASKLNSSIEDVDAFQRAVKGMGGESAAALDSLVKIGEKVNEAFADAESGARKDFAAWGMAFKDAGGQALGASEAMLELAGNLENVSRAEALARIKKLGIEDAASIDLLLKGRAALEQRIRAEKELGVVTEEQAANVREYYGEMGRAQNALTSIGNTILQAALPAMTRLTRAFGDFVEWIQRNKTLVTGFFIGLATVITLYYLPAMYSAAVATLAATWPFLLIIAAVLALAAAFALAYEDVSAFLDGQPSLIGALLEDYEWLRDAVEAIGDALVWLKDTGVAVWDALKAAVEAAGRGWDAFVASMQPVFDAFDNLGRAISAVFGAIVDQAARDLSPAFDRVRQSVQAVRDAASAAYDLMTGGVDGIINAVKRLGTVLTDVLVAAFDLVRSAWDRTIGAIAGGVNSLADRLSAWAGSIAGGGEPANDNQRQAASGLGALVGGNTTALMQQAQAASGAASGAAINGRVAGAFGAVNNTSNVTVGSVTVNTQATDARAVAGAVRGELERQLRGTAAQFDDGVAR